MRKMLQDDLADKEARLAELETGSSSPLAARPQRGPQRDRRDPGTEGGRRPTWAGDLFRMYQRFAERHKLKIEVLSSQPSDQGGYRDVTFVVKGDDAWGRLKYEGGPHRAARARYREPGSHPHERGDRRRAARSRRGRRRGGSQRSRHRRVPLDRTGRPVGQHHRLRGAHHTPADRARRRGPGREESAAEQGQGHAHPARDSCNSNRTVSRPR